MALTAARNEAIHAQDRFPGTTVAEVLALFRSSEGRDAPCLDPALTGVLSGTAVNAFFTVKGSTMRSNTNARAPFRKGHLAEESETHAARYLQKVCVCKIKSPPRRFSRT